MAMCERKVLTIDEAKNLMLGVFLHNNHMYLKVFYLDKGDNDSESGLIIKESTIKTQNELSDILDKNITMIHVISKSDIIQYEIHIDPRDVSRKLENEIKTKSMDVLKYIRNNEGISEDQIGIRSPDDIDFVMKVNELLASEITEIFINQPELLDKYYLMFLPYTDNDGLKIRLVLTRDDEVLYRTTFDKKDNDIIINMKILKFKEYVKELLNNLSSSS